jgi:hypothetical protein
MSHTVALHFHMIASSSIHWMQQICCAAAAAAAAAAASQIADATPKSSHEGGYKHTHGRLKKN